MVKPEMCLGLDLGGPARNHPHPVPVATAPTKVNNAKRVDFRRLIPVGAPLAYGVISSDRSILQRIASA